MAEPPIVVVIAGPNGAGKSTFAREVLTTEYALPFVNADDMARSLNEDDVRLVALEAGRNTLRVVDDNLAQGRSFALETTLSGRGYWTRFARAVEDGWRLHLHYVWLSSPELAVARVGDRAALGGHSVPTADIVRRFARGLTHLPNFVGLSDLWYLYDNSADSPELVASGTSTSRHVHLPTQFARIAQGRESKWPKEL